MVLTTSNPDWKIDPDAVQEICCLPDDLYRLRWISYAYWNIDHRLRAKFDSNASWPGFARWSAYTISEALRLDDLNPRLADVLRRYSLPDRVVGPLVQIQRELRALDDGAMPTVLALGNRLVFHEVGWNLAEFLGFVETHKSKKSADAGWGKFCHEKLKPFEATDFFRPCYREWLFDGIQAYYDAWWESNDDKKAQLILRGNILIGAYEQWRVDSFFEVALDFNPGALIKELRTSDHSKLAQNLVGIKHANTRRALRHQWAMLDWMADAYAAFLTQSVLTWDAPLYGGTPSAIRLGSDIPAALRKRAYEHNLEKLDVETRGLFEAFDRSGGQIRGAGARNWRRFTDRMSFIVNLFRTQQQNPNLKVQPLKEDERLLALQLNDPFFDDRRTVGDPLYDDFVRPIVADYDNPRTFAHDLVEHGHVYVELTSHLPEVDQPPWADPEKIKAGQEFFVKEAMPIATALVCASLPKAYTAAKGARVLFTTAEMVSDVKRRIAETARLLLAVLTPDGKALAKGSRGYHAVLSVRAFHSAMRCMLQLQEPWRSDPKHEVPINQEDLLGTLTTFTVIVLESLEMMGIAVDDHERDCYLHTWLVAGHYLGIEYESLRPHMPGREFNPRLEPLTYFEMQLVRDTIFRRQEGASPSGQILARALLDVMEDALPRVLRPLPPAAIRRFIGDDAADLLEIPPAGPLRVGLAALGPIGASVDWFARGRFLRPRLEDMTAELFRQWTAVKSELSAVPHFEQEWHLAPDVIDLATLEAEERAADPVWVVEG